MEELTSSSKTFICKIIHNAKKQMRRQNHLSDPGSQSQAVYDLKTDVFQNWKLTILVVIWPKVTGFWGVTPQKSQLKYLNQQQY